MKKSLFLAALVSLVPAVTAFATLATDLNGVKLGNSATSTNFGSSGDAASLPIKVGTTTYFTATGHGNTLNNLQAIPGTGGCIIIDDSYANASNVNGPYSITVTATGALASFTLSSLELSGFVANDKYTNITVTGVALDNSPVAFAATPTTITGASAASVTPTANASTPIKAFTISFSLAAFSGGDPHVGPIFDFSFLSLTVNNAVGANIAPTFIGATTTLALNQFASATDIKALLHVSDLDSSQTLTWSQSAGPAHGTLNFSGATATSGTGNVTPGGTITYTPAASYSGSDSFTVQVSDGVTTATRTINVTVTDITSPTVASVVRLTPSTQPLTTATTSVTFRVTYSEAVTGIVAANFQIENFNGGSITGTVGTPTGSTTVYDVPVTLTGGSGEFRLKVIN